VRSAAAGAVDASGGGQGGGWEATGAGGSEGLSGLGTGSAGAAGGCLPRSTSCMPVPRGIVPVACQGMTGECSGALDCPCHACIETARAAVSLGSGRLGLILPNRADALLVFRLSKRQGPAVTVGSLSSHDWSQAHVVVDPACLDDYVMVRFPSAPRPLPSSGRFVGCLLFFDRPHGLADERDAELLAWFKAEELRQERWWRQRAVAVLLGLHPRVGAISALRVLTEDAVIPILRIMRRASGPGLETHHPSAEKAALAEDVPSPTSTLADGSESDATSSTLADGSESDAAEAAEAALAELAAAEAAEAAAIESAEAARAELAAAKAAEAAANAAAASSAADAAAAADFHGEGAQEAVAAARCQAKLLAAKARAAKAAKAAAEAEAEAAKAEAEAAEAEAAAEAAALDASTAEANLAAASAAGGPSEAAAASAGAACGAGTRPCPVCNRLYALTQSMGRRRRGSARRQAERTGPRTSSPRWRRVTGILGRRSIAAMASHKKRGRH
jgi:hypothetical protein